MADSTSQYVYPYLLSASSDVTGGIDEFLLASGSFRWNRICPINVSTPRETGAALATVIMTLPMATPVAYIFDEVCIL